MHSVSLQWDLHLWCMGKKLKATYCYDRLISDIWPRDTPTPFQWTTYYDVSTQTTYSSITMTSICLWYMGAKYARTHYSNQLIMMIKNTNAQSHVMIISLLRYKSANRFLLRYSDIYISDSWARNALCQVITITVFLWLILYLFYTSSL